MGAGASAQCIPVVNGMAEDLQNMLPKIQELYVVYDDMSGFYTTVKDDISQKIITLFTKLSEACIEHYSIDTYAKKLFLTDPSEFKSLKLSLSLYFTLKQILTPPDKRYDNFFSSILSKGLKLPDKIKIISWNYDFQVERSYLEFDQTLDMNSCRTCLGLHSQNDWAKYIDYIDKFQVIKLNGSARIKTVEHDGYLVGKLTKDIDKLAKQAIDIYLNIVDNDISYESELKFAWENDQYEALFDAAKQDLSHINVLVVIGYSFPFFNREVDMALFQKMTSLKKIIVQDLNPEDIIETMEEFIDMSGRHKMAPTVIAKRNVNQFVFPKELDVIS